MHIELTQDVTDALRLISTNSMVVIDIFSGQELILEGYATYTVFAGWVVTEKGREYLTKNPVEKLMT